MADVRSLLKSQRSARQIRHPHASYTSKGQLSCSLCQLILKSDAQWEQHLRSEEHASSLQKAKVERAKHHGAGNSTKKRKASDDFDASAKRVRSDSVNDSVTRADIDEINASSESEKEVFKEDDEDEASTIQSNNLGISREQKVDDEAIDVEEFAAMEREMQALEEAEQTQQRLESNRAYGANTVISAKPMTAEEIAARDREERSAQRGKREQELEDEREEAQEQLQEEFDRMDQLDERVKELRQRKAALEQRRQQQAPDVNAGGEEEVVGDVPSGETSDESEDDVDEWGFGIAER